MLSKHNQNSGVAVRAKSKPKSDKTISKESIPTSSNAWWFRFFLFTTLLILVIIAVDYTRIKQGRQVARANVVTLSINSDTKSVRRGQVFTVNIWLDSVQEPINAVQAQLNYPADKLEFVSIDAAGSAFEIQAQSSGGNGSVAIARGHDGSVSGRLPVAKVNFRPLLGNGSATISFGELSAAVRSSDNNNALKSTKNVQLSLEEAK